VRKGVSQLSRRYRCSLFEVEAAQKPDCHHQGFMNRVRWSGIATPSCTATSLYGNVWFLLFYSCLIPGEPPSIASDNQHRLASATPAPCTPRDLSHTSLLRPADNFVTMASHDGSETHPEDDDTWPQNLSWSTDYGPVDRNTYRQIDDFNRPSGMTPHESQPHTTEPYPFFGSWNDASPAHVLTQRKAHALTICGCTEQLTDTRWSWARSQSMGVRCV
jgi:hypothetical protein